MINVEDDIPADADAILAVTAHGLLGPLASIGFAAQLLLERWEKINDEDRRYFLQVIVERSRFTGEVLRDLVRGLPVEVSGLLDDLHQEAARRHAERLHDPAEG